MTLCGTPFVSFGLCWWLLYTSPECRLKQKEAESVDSFKLTLKDSLLFACHGYINDFLICASLSSCWQKLLHRVPHHMLGTSMVCHILLSTRRQCAQLRWPLAVFFWPSGAVEMTTGTCSVFLFLGTHHSSTPQSCQSSSSKKSLCIICSVCFWFAYLTV